MTQFDYDVLPKKRMGAGCLFFNEEGQVLLVKPSYKPGWEIPGGIVEQNESPRQCCQREIKEELGFDKIIERLLLVDYNGPFGEKTESLMFVFYGGVLSPEEIDQIQLHPKELEGYQFFTPDDLPDTIAPSLRYRVLQAWQQIDQAGTLYLENIA